MAENSKLDEVEEKLKPVQLARIERNRQKALLLRQSRLMNKPYSKDKCDVGHKVKGPSQVIDTGAGFFLEDEDEDDALLANVPIKHAPGPVLTDDKVFCEDCGKEMVESYLKTHFNIDVCDVCRQNEEKHNLITKTDAKTKYLLRDADFDVYKRAMEVWKSEEKIEEAREKREENKERTKRKKFDKKVKELRLAVRGSLMRKDRGPHQHEYGAESYDEDEDEYSRTCQTCGHMDTYEKM